jgi:isoleucyl-tRNA synthetase
VLDQLHRCLTIWLAPVLVFTAEEAWEARFGAEESVHLQTFPEIPIEWRDAALAAKWEQVRERRRAATLALEEMRRAGQIGSSLQAEITLGFAGDALLTAEEWADVLIVPAVTLTSGADATAAGVAPGGKCARCWKMLPEVGRVAAHPALCLRCADAVESGLMCKAAE